MKLNCDITLPASKSESNRALMIAAYGGFAPDFRNLSESNDTLVLAKAIQDISDAKPEIYIADCGTAARFLTTYLACHEGDWLLIGTERMHQRPMSPLVDALNSLGADIQYVESYGCLPLRIKGRRLSVSKTYVDITQSSQFASSLLLAAPLFPQGLELELLGELSSMPYLDMTLEMLRHFMAQVKRNGRTVVVKSQPYQKLEFTVEPDWTAASYWYEMAAFSEECEIRLRSLGLRFLNMSKESKRRPHIQGDAIISKWMQQLGVGTFVEGEDVILRKIPFEKGSLNFDFSQHLDLYPTMAAICAGLNVEARFTGLDNLVFKESNRVEAMQTELAKLAKTPICFSAHNDHRVVMALAPLSMLIGPVSFDYPDVVEKSYPNYWEDTPFLPVKR